MDVCTSPGWCRDPLDTESGHGPDGCMANLTYSSRHGIILSRCSWVDNDIHIRGRVCTDALCVRRSILEPIQETRDLLCVVNGMPKLPVIDMINHQLFYQSQYSDSFTWGNKMHTLIHKCQSVEELHDVLPQCSRVSQQMHAIMTRPTGQETIRRSVTFHPSHIPCFNIGTYFSGISHVQDDTPFLVQLEQLCNHWCGYAPRGDR